MVYLKGLYNLRGWVLRSKTVHTSYKHESANAFFTSYNYLTRLKEVLKMSPVRSIHAWTSSVTDNRTLSKMSGMLQIAWQPFTVCCWRISTLTGELITARVPARRNTTTSNQVRVRAMLWVRLNLFIGSSRFRSYHLALQG